MALNEIKAGEVLYFSDASYHGGVFVAENLLKLEVPEDIPAGTVSGVDAGNLPAGYSSLADTAYSVPGSLTLTPSGTGDQLVIFQDENVADAAGFRGLSAINAASTGWGRTGTSATESDLYPGMTNGVNAVAVGAGSGSSDEFDNVRYVGPTRGSRDELLESIYDPANWEGTNDSQAAYVSWTNASGMESFSFGGVSFADAVGDAGLEAGASLPGAIPFGDGVENLLKFAFNLELGGFDARPQGVDGEAGLPRYSLFENGEGRFWRLEFMRRINGGLIYRPMKSSSLEQSSFVPMTGTELVTPVNDEWERVTIDEPYDEVDASTMFGVVEVELDR